ncbi:MAG: hypothetical protein V9F04_04780 [Dermatophilaceae bacterium]|jgi:hypothetical protein
MRGISRDVLARDIAWKLGEGNCKELTQRWAAWETAYLTAQTVADRARILIGPAAVCDDCPVALECRDLAALSLYTGIAGGRAYRNGRPDTYRIREPFKNARRIA